MCVCVCVCGCVKTSPILCMCRFAFPCLFADVKVDSLKSTVFYAQVFRLKNQQASLDLLS